MRPALAFALLLGCGAAQPVTERAEAKQALSAPCGTLSAPGDHLRTLTSGGRSRAFTVHVPPGYRSQPTPLLFDFHGATMTRDDERRLTGILTSADERTFLAVHAQGVNNGWNAGLCCGNMFDVDDVGFVRDLVATLSQDYCVDAKRIYATGFSNGGFLSHRLACELSGTFAAIAPVGGVMGISPCTPTRPVSVFQFHGVTDASIPYNGNATLPSVMKTMTDWAARNGCSATSVEGYRQGGAHCESWPGCRAGSEVSLCTLDALGHRWPAGTQGAAGGSAESYELDATWLMLDFFFRHPMP